MESIVIEHQDGTRTRHQVNRVQNETLPQTKDQYSLHYSTSLGSVFAAIETPFIPVCVFPVALGFMVSSVNGESIGLRDLRKLLLNAPPADIIMQMFTWVDLSAFMLPAGQYNDDNLSDPADGSINILLYLIEN